MKEKNLRWGIAAAFFILLLLGASIYTLIGFDGRVRAVSDGSRGEGKPYGSYYVLIESGNDNVLWNSIYEGARKEGEENCDAYVEYFGRNLTTDYTVADKLRIAIDAGVDGIILNGDGSQEVNELVKEAADKGIPVVTALEDSAFDLRVCFVGVNNYNLGQEYSNLVWKLLSRNPRDATVAVLMDAGSTDTGKSTLYLLREALDTMVREKDWAYNLEVWAIAIDSGNAFVAEETIRNLLVNKDAQPDILICLSETDTRRAYEAVVDYIKVGEVNILGYYESEAILNAIQKEVIFSTVAVDGEQLGSFCVQALAEYQESGRVNGYFPVDLYVIDQDNVEHYLTKYQE